MFCTRKKKRFHSRYGMNLADQYCESMGCFSLPDRGGGKEGSVKGNLNFGESLVPPDIHQLSAAEKAPGILSGAFAF